MKEAYQVAILYICTGKYVAFWKDFYQSFEKHFLKKSRVEYFVFTDADCLYGEEENDRIHRIYQENLGWPGNTLFRFRMFCSIEEQLSFFDFVFFMNANTVCMQPITEQEFLPLKEDLLVVRHPGYYKTDAKRLPYERRKESRAFIPRGKGTMYVFGAINGGKKSAYLKMAAELARDIQEDYAKGIIAKWHDESHLNYYIWKHNNCKVLPPAYAYPEGWNMPFDEKIKVLDKNRYIELDHEKLRELEQRSVLKKTRNVIADIWNKVRKPCK